ncbi:Ig-like domain-containing protein [Vreelandella aquamarina]|uniref:immunoglobulin-like domain-containing protein n=1 Tax=Vreelandella aquamarina TaxID=77097 RepID=UPI00384F5DCA
MATATVIAITGQAWARDEDGNLRELAIGDVLQEGETLVTSADGRVELDFADGTGANVVEGGQEVAVTPDLVSDLIVATDASAQDDDLEALLAALDDEEGDLLDILDATAAGGGAGGGGGGGSSFVRVARIAEETDPLSFNTEGGLEGAEFVEFDGGDVAAEDAGDAADPAPVPEPGTDGVITLTGPQQVTEGQPITISASINSAPQGTPLVITLSNGQQIVIAVGETTGSVTFDSRPDDAYLQSDGTISIGIETATGGGYETIDTSAETTVTVSDDNDVTTITLSAPEAVTEGEPITVSASVNNAPQGSPLVITLSNGQQITIAVGETTGSVTFDSRGDDVYQQGTDTLNLSIETAEGGNYEALDSDATATVTVSDDADATTITLSAPEAVTEGESITVSASVNNAPQGSPLVITLNNGQQITIAVGETTGSVTFESRDDDQLVQGDSSQEISIQNALGGGYETIVSDAQLTVGVLDNDSVQLTISEAGTINEGDIATFNVSLGSAVDNATTLTFDLGEVDPADVGTPIATIGGEAVTVTANENGTYSFTVPAGTAAGIVISVPTIDDAVFEGREEFTLTATLSGATASGDALPEGITDSAEATIVDDGNGPGDTPDNDTPTISVTGGGDVNEGSPATFSVTLSNALEADHDIRIDTQLGTAEAGDLGDMTVTYVDGSGTTQTLTANTDGSYTVPAGITALSVSVETTQDTVYEGQETFTLTAGSDLVGDGSAEATIVDDGNGPGDTPDNDTPTISVTGGGDVNEGSPATFSVTLSNALEADHDIRIDTQLGTAEAGDLGDMTVTYVDGSGTTQTLTANTDGSYTVPAGITALSVSVETTQDTVYEGQETFTLTAGSDLVGDGSAEATIVDDGNGPGDTPDNDTPTISVTGGGDVNEGSPATFSVTLSNALEADHDIRIDTQLGTAEAGDLGDMTVTYVDGSGTTQTLTANTDGSYTVPAGITALSVSVETTQDTVYEGQETFTLTAGSDLVGDGSAEATIVDDGNGPGDTPDNDTPTISVTGGGDVNEGSPATFSVTLSNALEADHDIRIDTQLGTAEAGDLGDMTVTYVDGSGTTQTLTANTDGSYTVPAGITALSVSVETTQDTVYEGQETFTLTAGSDLVGDGSAEATIVDDGNGPGDTPDNDTPTISVTGGGDVNEGSPATFSVTLSNALEADHDIRIDTQLGTAEAGDLGDMTVTYVDGSGTTQTLTANTDGSYTVPAGITALSVSVETTQDTVYEGQETFTLTAGSDLVGDGSAEATIVDDGNGPGDTPDNDTPTISVTGGGDVNEGSPATFSVTLSNALEADHDIRIDTQLGTAEAGDLGDMTVTYVDGSGTTQTLTANTDGSYTVPAGITALSVSVETTQDTVYEGQETFTLTAGSDLVGDGSAEATIVDDGNGPGDTPDNDTPTISVTGGGDVNEGSPATFSVTLSNALEADHDIRIDTQLGTAEAGDLGDMTVTYVDGSGTTQTLTANTDGSYTVPAGITALSVSVETTQDTVYEGQETFTLTAGSDLVGDGSAEATIVDDGNGPGDTPDNDTPTISVTGGGDVNEGSPATFSVTLSNALEADHDIRIDTQLGTAEAGDLGDMTVTYVDGSGTTQTLTANTDGSYTVPAGITALSVSVETTQDTVYEGQETFTLTAGSDLVGDGSAEATIVDDGNGPGDTPDNDTPTISVTGGGDVNEGSPATFSVTLSNALEADHDIRIDTQLGTAEAGDLGDMTVTYVDGSGTTQTLTANTDGSYTVPAGITALSVSVETTQDTVYEGQETFTLTAGSDLVGDGSAEATIVDDGNGPGDTPDNDTPTISVTGGGDVNEGSPATFSVTLSNALEADHDIRIDTQLGTAEAGDLGDMTVTYVDGSGTTQTLTANTDGSYTVPAGITALSVSVETTQDTVYEGQETFTLTAGSDLVGDGSAEATIVDDGNGPGDTPDNDTPTISVTGGGDVNEGSPATFSVTLSNALEADHDIRIDTQLGTAEAGDLGDMTVTYVDGSGTTQTLTANTDGSYTVPAGITALSVSVETTQDTVYEGQETFTLTAGSDLVGDGSAEATIVDDGNGPGDTPDNDTPTISVTGGGDVNEGSPATFSVTLSNALEADHDIRIDTQLGTAEAGDLGDMTVTYVDGSGTTQTLTANTDGSYTVPAGITALSVSVETTQDTVYEGQETFTLTAGSDLVGDGSAEATIVDDGNGPGDTPDNDTPTISVTGGGDVNEGSPATFSVTLSNALEADHDIRIDTQLGTAEAGDLGDMTVTYVDGSGTTQTLTANTDGSYTVPAGITALSVSVETTQDTVYEGQETFTLTAGSDLVGDGSAEATIVDDGNGPGDTPDNDTPTISVTGGGDVNEGSPATFSVTLSNALEADHDIRIDTQLGTAEAGDLGDMTVTYVDGSGTTQTLTANTDGSYTVPAGITALSVSVETTQDTVYEGQETFTLTAGSDLVGDGSAEATIVDDGNGPGDTPDNDTPTISVTGGGDVNEGSPATFSVTLSNALEADHDIRIDTQLGTAEAGDLGDMTVTYVDGSGTTQTLTANTDGSYTVPAGITALSVSVETTQDTVYEGQETFTLTAGSDLVGDGSAEATIVDDGNGPGDTPDNDTPTISVTGGGDVNEGSPATFSVTLSNALEADHDIRIDTQLGTAEAGDLGDMTVTYVDGSGTTQTLTANTDGSYTVPAGITALSVSVETTQDTVYEGQETFTLTAGSDLVGDGSAEATIVDDGNGPGDTPDNDTPTISVTGGGDVNEGSPATFSVTLSNALEADHDIRIDTQLGTAEAGDLGDMTVTYVDGSGTTQTLTANTDGSYTVPAGITALSVSVETTQDTVYEGQETFTLTAGSDLVGDGSAEATIVDDGNGPGDTPDNDTPTISVTGGGDVNEGSPATFSVTLSNALEADHDIRIDTQLGTAEAGDLGDMTVTYVDGSGTTQTLTANTDGSYTVPAGITALSVSVETTQDTVYEGQETFTLTAGSDLVGDGSAEATIVDDGNGPGDTPDNDTPTISVTGGGDVNEGSPATFSVTLSNALEADHDIRIDTQLGTAEAGDLGDMTVTYVDGSGTTQTLTANTDGSYTVPAGITALSVSVETTQDTVYEGQETFTLTAGSDLVGDGSAEATIVDDGNGPGDTPDNDTPTISVTGGGDVNEGSPATFSVTLSNALEADHDIRIDTQLGTAEAGDLGDMTVTYVDGSGTTQTLTANTDGSYTVPAGITALSVSVETTQDTVYEGQETFTLTAGSDLVGDGSAEATIVDDGNGPGDTPDNDTPTISVTGGGDVNEGSPATFSVTLSNALEADHDIRIDTQLGTAEAGDLGDMTVTYVDGSGTTQTLTANTDGSYTVPAGITALSVSVETTQDTVYEGQETFTLTAGSDLVGDGSAEATIVDDGNGPGDTPDNDTPTISVTGGGDVNEGSPATFSVTLSNALEADHDIRIDTQLGTAEAGDLGDMTVTYVDGSGTTQTLTANTDGSYTVPAGITALSVSVETTQDTVYEGQETFTLTAGSDLVGDGSAEATIVDDEDANQPPDAQDDTNEVAFNETLNVGDDNGVLSNDTDPDNNTLTVTEVEGSAANVGAAIQGKFGTLTLNSDGSYDYVSNQPQPVLYGFADGDDNLQSNLLSNFTLDTAALQRVQVTANKGVGVADSNDGRPVPDQINDNGEVMVVDMGDIIEGTGFSFGVSNLFNNENGGESGAWYTYNEAGELVGSGTFGPDDVAYQNGSNNVGRVNVSAEDAGDFRYIAFEGLAYESSDVDTDGGDYFLTDITLQESFDYTITDGEGGSDSATLTVDSTSNLADYEIPLTLDDSQAALVDEDGLENGIAGGPGDREGQGDDESTFTGKIGVAGAESLNFAGMDGQTATVGQEQVKYSWANGVLTATISDSPVEDREDEALFKVELDDAGNYTVTLLENVLHDTLDGKEGDNTENDASVVLDYSAKNAYGDIQSGELTIDFNDDTPTVEEADTVTVTNEGIPNIYVGSVDFTGNNGSQSQFTFADGNVVVTAQGFVGKNDLDLEKADVNQSGQGLGVASEASPYHNLDNEVDFRKTADDEASETLTIALKHGQVAYGAQIEFAKMFGGELETGVAEFYRDGELISTQSFSSDTASGNFAGNFQVEDGGFDTIVLKADDNGKGPNHNDNSDFTVSSIEFIGSTGAPIGYAKSSLEVNYGADGPGSLALTGLAGEVALKDGTPVTDIDISGNTIVARDGDGELVFQLQMTPATGQWEFFQYQALQEGSLSVDYRATDADGDSVESSFALDAIANSAPESTDDEVNANAGEGLVLTTADFGEFIDPDSGDKLQSVRIETLPDASAGVLTLNGDAVEAGDVISADAISNGDLVYTQTNDAAQDTAFDFSVSDGFAWSQESYSLVVNADSVPTASGETRSMDFAAATADPVSSNIYLTLDTSGSMNDAIKLANGDDTTRFELAKDALVNMINSYEGMGDVNVKLTTFGASATDHGWKNAEDVIALIEQLQAGGKTNYEDAVAKTVSGADSAPPSDQTIVYFISDGDPTTENDDGYNGEPGLFDGIYQDSWNDFVSNHINSLNVVALGGGITNTDYLDQLAKAGNNVSETLVIENESGLEAAIDPVRLTLDGDLNDNVTGGDGAISFVSITVDGTTYTAADFADGATIALQGDGQLAVDFAAGTYSYSATAREFTADTQKQFTVTASDADGDTANFDVIFDINVDTQPTASNEQAITSDGTLEGNLLDNVDFGSDGKGANGGLKSLKAGDTSYTPDVNGDIVINKVLGGTLTANINTGEYTLSGAALGTTTLQIMAEDADGDEVAFDFDITSAGDSTTKETDDFNSGNDGWSSQGSYKGNNAYSPNDYMEVWHDESVSKTFSGFNPGDLVEISFDAWTSTGRDGWEKSGNWKDEFIVKSNGEEKFQHAGGFSDKIAFEAMADENGEITLSIENHSTTNDENLYIDNVELTSGSSVGSILIGDDDSAEQFVLDDSSDDVTIEHFDVANDVLDLSDLLDDGSSGSVDDYLISAADQGDDLEIEIRSNSDNGSSKSVTLKDVSQSDFADMNEDVIKAMIEAGQLKIDQ